MRGMKLKFLVMGCIIFALGGILLGAKGEEMGYIGLLVVWVLLLIAGIFLK
jgi:hypothetical protein